MERATAWVPRRRDSRLTLAVAAGRPVPPERQLTGAELATASRHGLLGLLAHSGHPHLAPAALPAYSRLAARQQVMERLLRHVLERLAMHGVRATVVKGPALARWAYRDPRLRTFTDVDLLVPAGEVEAALEVLRRDDVTVGIPRKTPKADKRNIPLADPSGIRFTLDLHWDLFSYTQLRGCAAGAIDEAWRRGVWAPDHALGPMWLLPDETLIGFLTTHALLDHRFRLILFRDLAEVAARGIDWCQLDEFCDRFGLRSTGYVAWSIAAAAIGADVPDGVLAKMRPRSMPLAVADRLLPRTDLVQFDGHSADLLNLAMVLLHDRWTARAALLVQAPLSFPSWLRRVEQEPDHGRPGRSLTGGADLLVRRVLHLLPVDIVRGAQTYARSMRDLLDSEEIEHRTVTIFESEAGALNADVNLGVPRGRGRRWGFSPIAGIRLWWYLRRARPDVVVAHGGESLKYAALVTPPTARLVYYKIGAAGSRLDAAWRRRLYRVLVSRADLVVGVSAEMLTESDVLLSVPPDQTVLIPNGRDPSRFPVRDRRRAADHVMLLLLGRLEESKRPGLFLDLVAELRRRGIDARGVIAGDGPLLKDLRSRADGHVAVLGRRDDVPELLNSADLLVLVSLHEGMPGVLIEAGMAGLPSVTTDVEGARAVVEDGVTGLVVPRHDFDRLVEATASLARDPELRRRMGEAARRRCVERFTLEASARRWTEELERLMAEGAR